MPIYVEWCPTTLIPDPHDVHPVPPLQIATWCRALLTMLEPGWYRSQTRCRPHEVGTIQSWREKGIEDFVYDAIERCRVHGRRVSDQLRIDRPPSMPSSPLPLQEAIDFLEELEGWCNTIGTPRNESPPPKVPQTDLESLALAMLAEDGHITVSQIANRIGVHRTELYRWSRFRSAAERLGIIKPKGRTEYPIRGMKNAQGTLEAYTDDEATDSV
jgi:hypothetical protein